MHVRMSETIREPLMELQALYNTLKFTRASIGEVVEVAIRGTLEAMKPPMYQAKPEPTIKVVNEPFTKGVTQRRMRGFKKTKSKHSLIPKKQTSQWRTAAKKKPHVRKRGAKDAS